MIGALGELLGAAAVVISLLYLASQIKQNTAVSRSEAFREFSIEAARWQMSIATDERLGTLMWKVFHHRARRAELPEEDRARVATAFMSSLYLLEASFHSAQEGIITDAELRVMSRHPRCGNCPSSMTPGMSGVTSWDRTSFRTLRAFTQAYSGQRLKKSNPMARSRIARC